VLIHFSFGTEALLISIELRSKRNMYERLFFPPFYSDGKLGARYQSKVLILRIRITIDFETERAYAPAQESKHESY
jgi:hypothetical protein